MKSSESVLFQSIYLNKNPLLIFLHIFFVFKNIGRVRMSSSIAICISPFCLLRFAIGLLPLCEYDLLNLQQMTLLPIQGQVLKFRMAVIPVVLIVQFILQGENLYLLM